MPITPSVRRANAKLFGAFELFATAGERGALIEAALADGANVNASSVRKSDGAGMRPLHAAAKRGCVESVKRLLAAGARVDAVSAGGNPLHFAALCREPQAGELIEALAEAGCDPRGLNAEGEPPLALALRQGALGAAQKLLDQGARWEDLDALKKSPLIEALERVDEAAACFMLDGGVSPLSENLSGRSALRALAEGDRSRRWGLGKKGEAAALRLADRLLAAGCVASGLHKGAVWEDTLLCAGLLAKAPRSLLERLREAGATVAAEPGVAVESRVGVAGLARGGDIESLSLAFELGLDPNWADQWGDSMARWVMDTRYVSMYAALEWVLEKGCDPNRLNKRGVSPLLWAGAHECQGSPERLVEILLAAGADPNLPVGPESLPTLAVALRPEWLPLVGNCWPRPCSGVVKALIEAGGDVNSSARGMPLLCAASYGMGRELVEAGADTRVAALWLAEHEPVKSLYSRWGVDQWLAKGLSADDLIAGYPLAMAVCPRAEREEVEAQGTLSYLEALALKSELGSGEARAPAARVAPRI